MADAKLDSSLIPGYLTDQFITLALAENPSEAVPAFAASLLDHLPLSAYTCFHDGRNLIIKSISGGITRLLGYNKEELIDKKTFRDLAVDDTPYQNIPSVYQPNSSKEFACLQMYYTADRGIKLLIDRGYFFYDDSGRLTGTAGVLLDFGLDPGLDIYEYSQPHKRKLKAEDEKTVNLCGNIASQSIIMKSIFERIIKLSTSTTNVVIKGESGTGKELVARAIHDLSPRRHQAFVAVNCGSLSEHLIESEFFGYVKGAFTGASSQQKGFLAEAHRGTLFLDEVGEMPLNMQTKLLRVLDGYGYIPVGGNKPTFPDFRLLCATHRNLEDLVEAGLMRSDFYYRLKEVEMRLPPLRERKEDIPVLVDYFVTKYHEKNHGPGQVGPKTIVPEAVKSKFMTYDWPGNVRELQHAVNSFLSLKEFNLPDGLKSGQPASSAVAAAPTPVKPQGRRFHEEQKVRQALEKNNWDLDAAARDLKVSKRTLYRYLSKYNLA